MVKRFLHQAFSLLELLFTLSLATCILGGLGYWMLHYSQSIQTVQYKLKQQNNFQRFVQALHADFSNICFMQYEPWLNFERTNKKTSFELMTTRGKILYRTCTQGWERVVSEGTTHVFESLPNIFDFSVWGRISLIDSCAIINSSYLCVINDEIALPDDQHIYNFGWLELNWVNNTQNVVHRFRPLHK